MSEVTCARCGETREGLDRAPLPGVLGASILAHTCAVCWEGWKAEQIRVINHFQLRPQLAEDREKLYEITREALKLPPDGRGAEI